MRRGGRREECFLSGRSSGRKKCVCSLICNIQEVKRAALRFRVTPPPSTPSSNMDYLPKIRTRGRQTPAVKAPGRRSGSWHQRLCRWFSLRLELHSSPSVSATLAEGTILHPGSSPNCPDSTRQRWILPPVSGGRIKLDPARTSQFLHPNEHRWI